MNLPRLSKIKLPRFIQKLLKRSDGSELATIQVTEALIGPENVITHEQVYAELELNDKPGIPPLNQHLFYTVAELKKAAEDNASGLAQFRLVYCVGFSHQRLLEMHGMEPAPEKPEQEVQEKTDVPEPGVPPMPSQAEQHSAELTGIVIHKPPLRKACYLKGTRFWMTDWKTENLLDRRRYFKEEYDTSWYTAGAEAGYRLIDFKPRLVNKPAKVQESGLRAFGLAHLKRLPSNVLAEALFNIYLVTGEVLMKDFFHLDPTVFSPKHLGAGSHSAFIGCFGKHGLQVFVFPRSFMEETFGFILYLDHKEMMELPSLPPPMH